MTQTTVIHARIQPALKAKAEKVFKKLGITTTQAISMFLAAVVHHRGIPFDLKLSQNLPSPGTASPAKPKQGVTDGLG